MKMLCISALLVLAALIDQSTAAQISCFTCFGTDNGGTAVDFSGGESFGLTYGTAPTLKDANCQAAATSSTKENCDQCAYTEYVKAAAGSNAKIIFWVRGCAPATCPAIKDLSAKLIGYVQTPPICCKAALCNKDKATATPAATTAKPSTAKPSTAKPNSATISTLFTHWFVLSAVAVAISRRF